MADYPMIIGHRGFPGRYPENTLVGLLAAAEAGAHGVELDVQISADGVPVVIHDPDLWRTTGRRGFVFELKAAELKGIGAGEPLRFGERYRGEPIPTLHAVAEALSAFPGLRVFIEIKWDAPRHQIPDVTKAVLNASQPLGDRRVVIGFDERLLQEARSLADVPIGWALRAWDRFHRERAGTLQPEYLFCDRDYLPLAPELLWPGPWQWVVYEINDREEARKLASRGVTAVETADVASMLDAEASAER